MTLTVQLPEIVVEGHRLGRTINHDPRSKAYRVERTATVESKRWTRRVGIFDQGRTGSCTGNAAVGALGTDPFYSTLPTGTTCDENEARTVYSDAEKLDGGAGLPSEDNGSSGLSVAKVCKTLGLISGYTHALSVDDFIAGMQKGPGITGISWLTGCDSPNENGLVRWSGKSRGGHEIEADEIDLERELVGFDNSWNTTWGVQGRFYMSIADYTKALADSGDATFFVPLSQPAPTPTPVPAPSDALATFSLEAAPWAALRHTGANGVMATATRAYLLAAALKHPDAIVQHHARHGFVYIDARNGHFASAADNAADPDHIVRLTLGEQS